MSTFRAKLNEPTLGCPISLLSFDYGNPRLLKSDDLVSNDEKSIICTLRDIAALDELIRSICSNGYINIEPIIVLGDSELGPFTVLEGNRRLASIKLIKDGNLARECKISVPHEISQTILDSIEKVSIWWVKDRSDAQAFINFKHFNGPHRWDAYAKGKFVTDWYKRDKEKGLTIESIARQLGDDNDTIRSFIGAILILEQAEEERLFSIKDRAKRGPFAFSHVYTALGRKEYQDFLGLPRGWNANPSERPIDKKKKLHLKETLTYLYGSKQDDKPSLIKSQNPDLKQIGEVLVHPVALEKLRGGADLATAYNETREPNEIFGDALVQASLKIEAAVVLLAKYDGSTALLSIAKELAENSEILFLTMQHKHEKSLKK